MRRLITALVHYTHILFCHFFKLNNDRWTQDKHLTSSPMQLIIWCIHSNARSPHCALPHVRCMISIDACMYCPSATWTSSIVPSHWNQVCYIDSTDHYLPTITFHHLCTDLSFNAKVQGLWIQTGLIWSHNYTNPTREKDHTCSCQRFTDIIDSISWCITFKKKSMVIWSGRKW